MTSVHSSLPSSPSMSPPSTPPREHDSLGPHQQPARARALSDLLAKWADSDSEDEEEVMMHRLEVKRDTGSSPDATIKGRRHKQKMSLEEVGMLAIDLGCWINSNPSPQEPPVDTFFVPSSSSAPSSPSIPISNPFSASSHQRGSLGKFKSLSIPPSPSSTSTYSSQSLDTNTDSVAAPLGVWKGSPRGRVLIPAKLQTEEEAGGEYGLVGEREVGGEQSFEIEFGDLKID